MRLEAIPGGGPSPVAGDPPDHRRRVWISIVSFLASLFTATTLGAGWYLSTRTDVTTDLGPVLTFETIRRVWSEPALLFTGLAFSLPMLFILLCHELGHYLICRRYRIPASPPIFIPAPVALGTFGAFIRIRAPLRDRRQLLDIGAGGPLAGFVALLPFLIYGIARSTPAEVVRLAPDLARVVLLHPGDSLAVVLVTRLLHGPQPAGGVLDFHPFALAAWVGLLATALNLLPVGQLDGGHVLYAAIGRWQRRLAIPVWGLLVAAGLLWPGWWLWAVLLLLIGLRHPPVADERLGLGPGRRAIAWLCLALFVLSFMPVPIEWMPVAE